MFRTDKVTEHGYLPAYLAITAGVAYHNGAVGRRPVVVELGVRDGASLEMWQTLLPDAVVIGVDNSLACENACPRGTRFIHADQDDQDLEDRIVAVIADELGAFSHVDLLVDDASHDGNLTFISMQNLWPLVRPGGFYVIEDWYVGFGTHPDYDSSMLDTIHRTMEAFMHKPNLSGIESLELRYGMAIYTKA